MKIDYIGPATISIDDDFVYPALLNDQKIGCHFTYEALDDVESDDIQVDALTLFKNYQLRPLSIAEQKIRRSHTQHGQIQIFTSELIL